MSFNFDLGGKSDLMVMAMMVMVLVVVFRTEKEREKTRRRTGMRTNCYVSVDKKVH